MADSSYGALGVAGSPFFGLLNTASNIPGLDQTGLNEWLWSSPVWEETRNFRDQQPGWATGLDIASSFVPYVGWGTALNRAAALGRTAGVLGLTNKARLAAAGLGRGSQPLAFALGETTAYAPVSAGMTAFDAAGGGYESGTDAVFGFLGSNLAAAGLGAAGMAVSPAVQRLFRPGTGLAGDVIGGGWKAVFEPGPELSKLYGFSGNQQRIGRELARDEVVQGAVSPYLRPQQRASALHDLTRAVEDGTHPMLSTIPPEDHKAVLDLLMGQRDEEVRSIIREELNPTEAGFRADPIWNLAPEPQATIRQALSIGPNGSGNMVTVPLDGSGGAVNSLGEVRSRLGLPEEWVYDAQFPRMTAVAFSAAPTFRQHLGLDPSKVGAVWRRIERTGPTGESQVWSILQEPDGGWLMATEVPTRPGGEPHRMGWRARFGALGDPGEPGKMFLSMKTSNPGRLFENDGWRLDIDSPESYRPTEHLGSRMWEVDSRIPPGKSKFLDTLMDLRNVFLSPKTIEAGYESRLAGPKGRERFAKSLLEGPTMGKQIRQVFDTYAAPADTQLMRSPKARGVVGLYRAAFDAGSSRATARMHGTASIPEDKGPLAVLFGQPNMKDEEALAVLIRKAEMAEPGTVEIVRRYMNGDVKLDSLEGTSAGGLIKKLEEANLADLADQNGAIDVLRKAKATDEAVVPVLQGHLGISRRWEGDHVVPIYKEGSTEPDAFRTGHSYAEAKRKAEEWLKGRAEDVAARGKPPEVRRLGKGYIVGKDRDIPKTIQDAILAPNLLKPRTGMMGWEHQYEPYKHVDDFIAELDENVARRWRYASGVVADALTTGIKNQLRAQDPGAWEIVKGRIAQFQGIEGPWEATQNKIVDSILPGLGGKGAKKLAEGAAEFNFHLLHGFGNVATPLLNLTSVLQTQWPEALALAGGNPANSRLFGYQIPVYGSDGLPTRGFSHAVDPWRLIGGAFQSASNPSEVHREVFQRVINSREMGATLANEFVGQERGIAARASEGIRSSGDLGFWFKRASSVLMAKSEQISRVMAVGMANTAMDIMEKTRGVKFSIDQRVANSIRMVRATNYGYFNADRPSMFTSPAGMIFGNQKTWMVNYMFQMARYLGLGVNQGEWGPLLLALGTTTALGGVFAVPLLGQGADLWAKTFEDKDAREYIFENLGGWGNGISFGLPALLGVSLQGNVSAPGSNLAHDAEFFTSVVLLSRAEQLGRMVGRAWDDQVLLGMNPMKDEIWRRQALQALGPRSLYRAMDALTGELSSAATGYPMVQEFGLGARALHGLGFRSTDMAIQYSAYEHLLKDRDARRHKVSVFGERYAYAMADGDRQEMGRVLQQATVMGVDLGSVMQSAQVRLRAMNRDMFGRNFRPEDLERYQQSLEMGGRN